MIARLIFLAVYLIYLPFLLVGLVIAVPLVLIGIVALFVLVILIVTHDALVAGVQDK